MSFDLKSFTSCLERRDDGLWWGREHPSVSYPAHGNAHYLEVEDRSFWFRHRNRCITSLVKRFSPHERFLDIGGGNGYVAKGLVDVGIDCVLVEPGVDGARAALARGVDPVICARLEDAGLPAASFGAAGMFDVLEHIEDDAAALRHIREVLRPGGRLYLTVPAYKFLWSHDDVLAGHFRRYRLSDLTRLLAAVGFRIEFSSYIFAPLPPLVFMLRSVPSLLGGRREADPQRDNKEHTPGRIQAQIMDQLLAMEFNRIDSGNTLPFGGSCLCVAVRDS
jgi:SAM-dependent methyltransferase